MSEAEAKKPAARGGRNLELPEHLKAYKGVWVFIEHDRGVVHPVSWELLGEGRKLADTLGVSLAGVVMGGADEALDAIAKEAYTFGAESCYIVRDPVLKGYRNEPFTKGMTDLVNKYQPEIVLLGATTMGRDLAGSVATTLSTGLTADCTELRIDPATRALAATRPTFGGSLLCTIMTLAYRPQMATVRPRVMQMPDADPSRSGVIVEDRLAMIETDIVTKLLDFIADENNNKVNLAYADIIVSGGKGMKSPDNFKLVWELARVLGAEVGATRPVVQSGWVDAERQVGQTGKTVRPKLYIAAGISGAIQHRVGMEGADVIVAINTDANAPIFDFAHHGIVGNAMQVLPVLTETFREHIAMRSRKAA
ncbi:MULTISPECIES: electron transfer flavoprotein subunit alpha/FixB family protein [Zoogloea]|uniref:Electron transfer flavoprotein subunit alpha/FixB family protein n=1 Tax=Zoogloea oleivorans TaxID=1552750 RepID=A0A6C2CCU6_9RHOO|nr:MULTISPECIES: electron transfer flavoprotein subunit alpha/FixB family protein [Zoogloea]MDD2668454.1 electron transfer flavoprotein subunit alpha/FixB family protein [Zoogloea sp.]TYC51768.1 electron transfer flavoprotein subunit alpha/FixB family protein [Zoogloea oleivorans]